MGTDKSAGRVVCRFEGNSSEYRANMRSLGDFMRRQQGPGYQPYFSIKEKAEDPDIQKICSCIPFDHPTQSFRTSADVLA